MMLASHVRIDFPFDHAEILSGTSEVGGTLAWLSRVSSKPGRACDGVDRWVVLGRGEWSEERLERTPAAVAVEMVAAMRALGHSFGIAIPEPMHAIAHRFRFALATRTPRSASRATGCQEHASRMHSFPESGSRVVCWVHSQSVINALY
jgi:predicted NAD/FAD-dependent oxidoreductase